MKRLILLDSGPLGMAANPRAKNTPLICASNGSEKRLGEESE